jgi:hypothetical protein
MTDSLDDFIQEIQHKINEETKEAYGQAAFLRKIGTAPSSLRSRFKQPLMIT